MPLRITFCRTADDDATDVGFVLDESADYGVVRIFDKSDAKTIAGQLRALAARIEWSDVPSA